MKRQHVGKANADSDGFYYCEFCGCHTNARFRRCCDKGNEADRDTGATVAVEAVETQDDACTRCGAYDHTIEQHRPTRRTPTRDSGDGGGREGG